VNFFFGKERVTNDALVPELSVPWRCFILNAGILDSVMQIKGVRAINPNPI
jgi:hypothetical protein